uniref:Uncharacterized protein C10orf95-like n=1 Tax=Callorhinus ursinus TaxID=34884 RepID=A0A3Q7NLR2_CALUR|nr:uncharacterized protein C10orf95-like [Callorhinus ursinus]
MRGSEKRGGDSWLRAGDRSPDPLLQEAPRPALFELHGSACLTFPKTPTHTHRGIRSRSGSWTRRWRRSPTTAPPAHSHCSEPRATRTTTRTAQPAQRRGGSRRVPGAPADSPRLRSLQAAGPARRRGARPPGSRHRRRRRRRRDPRARSPARPAYNSLPRPGQARAGRTLDTGWYRPSRQDGPRARGAATPRRYACSGKASAATDLAPGGTAAARLPHTRCGQVFRDTKSAELVGHLCGSCRCAPRDLSASPRPLLPESATCPDNEAPGKHQRGPGAPATRSTKQEFRAGRNLEDYLADPSPYMWTRRLRPRGDRPWQALGPLTPPWLQLGPPGEQKVPGGQALSRG